MIKYRIHEVAKDFGLNSKDIIKILDKYGVEPRNHMTTLESKDLNIIFETFTQNNKVENFAKYFGEGLLNANAAQKEEAEPVKVESAPQTIKTVRVVDTKSASVDLSKFDERLETLVPDKTSKVAENSTGKQKFAKRPNNYQNKTPGGRYKQDQNKKVMVRPKPKQIELMLPEQITVSELAIGLKIAGAQVVKKLMTLGVMASLSDVIDYDTAAIVAEELGAKVQKQVVVTIEEKLFGNEEDEDAQENLVPRDPVVVVMGHVDHGKTSLLDAIRNAKVASGEAGGITQHIGAYRVSINGQKMTFLDTPGHEAFTAMRARGAQVTDIAILVVAADDGIMPQTIEAINHAKAAGVSIIVAINKIDKEHANIEKVKQELTEYELVPEEWGGDIICCPVSALKRDGIDNLLEMVILTAEMKELKANPNRLAKGTVIEAKLDKGRGPVATVLVQNGTLKIGDVIIAGTAVGRVRGMVDHNGKKLKEAGPSVPVEIIGLSEVPDGGDVFNAVTDEKMARTLVDQRKQKQKDEMKSNAPVTLEDLFSQIKSGSVKDLNVIVKADVQGSVEAVKQSLEKLSNEEVRVRCIHGGVGGIRESDVMLASASGAIIVGFNVRPDSGAQATAEANKVDVRTYRVIYEAIDEISDAIKGMLAPTFKEVITGHAEVRQTFKVTSVGTIAGCYMLDGKIIRNQKVRIVRDSIVIHEGEMSSLKRFKDDVKEVREGFECGIGIERFNDLKELDIIEGFIMEEVKR